ncbi:MAG: flagellar biosynthesis protein FliC [Oceanospirillaceae bacterium]|nr:flagellar biosynthesis protein FliC [Oceanospirillaceae bacterium]
MAMVINSNIQSLNAQRHLNNSLDAQNTATERLSSGLRINSAKDDAAGLAIANRMTSQIQGLNQAIRNANDGTALIQTAEGGLEEMTNILQRMRELSIQSANGTYDTGNRTTINAEVDQLKLEITRIAETTSFNGQNILDGSLGEINLQVGANANQTIAIDIDSLTTDNLGANGGDLIGAATTSLSAALAANTGGDLKINGDFVADLSAAALDTNAKKLQAFSDSVAGVEVTAFVELEGGLSAGGNGALSGDDELILTIAMQDGTADQVISVKDTSDMADLAAKITEAGGGNVSATVGDEGQLIVTSDVGSSITATENGDGLANAGIAATGNQQFAQLKFVITDPAITSLKIEGTAADLVLLGLNAVDGSSVSGQAAATTQLNADELVLNGVSVEAATAATAAANIIAINKSSSESGVIASAGTESDSIKLTSIDNSPIKIESGEGLSQATQELRDDALTTIIGLHVTNEAKSGTNTVQNIDLTSAAGAQQAISVLDEAIAQVSEVRGDLGAISNRLDYTTRNLANISENASSAKSQIMDADFAAESANLSRAQVLQQAGNAMLAQANARPQQVLSLLQ